MDTTDAIPRLKRFDVIREEEDEEAGVNKPMLKWIQTLLSFNVEIFNTTQQITIKEELQGDQNT